jgi:hypothetical protein
MIVQHTFFSFCFNRIKREGGKVFYVVEGKCGPENTTKIRVPEAAFRAEIVGRPRGGSEAG